MSNTSLRQTMRSGILSLTGIAQSKNDRSSQVLLALLGSFLTISEAQDSEIEEIRGGNAYLKTLQDAANANLPFRTGGFAGSPEKYFPTFADALKTLKAGQTLEIQPGLYKALTDGPGEIGLQFRGLTTVPTNALLTGNSAGAISIKADRIKSTLAGGNNDPMFSSNLAKRWIIEADEIELAGDGRLFMVQMGGAGTEVILRPKRLIVPATSRGHVATIRTLAASKIFLQGAVITDSGCFVSLADVGYGAYSAVMEARDCTIHSLSSIIASLGQSSNAHFINCDLSSKNPSLFRAANNVENNNAKGRLALTNCRMKSLGTVTDPTQPNLGNGIFEFAGVSSKLFTVECYGKNYFDNPDNAEYCMNAPQAGFTLVNWGEIVTNKPFHPSVNIVGNAPVVNPAFKWNPTLL